MMTHPTDDQLLLVAYAELPRDDAAGLEAHLAACEECRARFARLEGARAALDVALPQRRGRAVPWIAAGLAAAVLAAVVLMKSPPPRPENAGWRPASQWSTTAGYFTGGRTMMEIDAQLTRLETGRYYAQPN